VQVTVSKSGEGAPHKANTGKPNRRSRRVGERKPGRDENGMGKRDVA